jgi:uncharacterized damage-inducible protein DinB
MTLDELFDAWRINNAVNFELLELVADDDLELKPGKGKTIRSNYVHIMGVRRTWCEESLKAEAEKIPKLDWKTASRAEIIEGLMMSNEAMVALFAKKHASAKPGRWSLPVFFAYCIAHEAHHRSQIEIALRINGKEPDEMKLYALWDWSKK